MPRCPRHVLLVSLLAVASATSALPRPSAAGGKRLCAPAAQAEDKCKEMVPPQAVPVPAGTDLAVLEGHDGPQPG
jgi:hypothetical protein